MKSRIPLPKSGLKSLRWKTRLNIAPPIKLTERITTKIYIAEQSRHVFFHDDVSTDPQTALGDIVSRVWGYGTESNQISSPGPTLEAISNETIQIKWVNNLSTQVHHPFVEPPRELRSPGMVGRYDIGHTVVHLHGAHVPWTSDGYPMRVSKLMGKNPHHKKTVLRPGQHETFEYPNTQPGGATLWYHDHTMDATSMNVYAGLAGVYLLRHQCEHELASLPTGKYEIPLIIQDRSFTEDGELLYGDADFLNTYLGNNLDNRTTDPPQFQQDRQLIRGQFFSGQDPQPSPEFKGQVICVNGKIWPFLEVEPRPYRLRIVNGSNSRMYVLRLSNSTTDRLEPDVSSAMAAQSIWQIGADGGLFNSYVELNGNIADLNPTNLLVLAPGERADAIVDFSTLAGKSVYLTNHATNDSPLGNGGDAVPVDKNNVSIATTDGVLKFIVNTKSEQNATSPLRLDLPQLNLDLARIASPPNLATLPDPQIPTRQFVIKEFGPVPLTLEAAIAASPRGWKAITFQSDIDRPTDPGWLWAGLPPDIGGLPNGGAFPDPIPPPHHLGATIELWEFYNLSPDVHPIHLHHSNVQLYARVKLANPIAQTQAGSFLQGVAANERGWKDTIRVNPRELTRILVRFDDRGDKSHDYTGHYVWHCHILEHEDMGMMRPLEIER
jgi:spore coat protein A, manganese oxidase